MVHLGVGVLIFFGYYCGCVAYAVAVIVCAIIVAPVVAYCAVGPNVLIDTFSIEMCSDLLSVIHEKGLKEWDAEQAEVAGQSSSMSARSYGW